jgi:hypothetical protein
MERTNVLQDGHVFNIYMYVFVDPCFIENTSKAENMIGKLQHTECE